MHQTQPRIMSTCTTNPADVHAWSALTTAQLHRPTTKLPARRPDTGRGRPWHLPFADRVPLAAVS
jgi:hypothetical protein